MLSARQISEQLSFREFQRLCTYFDLKAAAKRKGTVYLGVTDNGSGGSQIWHQVQPLVLPAKFDVLNIERGGGELRVLCRDEQKELHVLQFTNLIEMPNYRKLDCQSERAA